MVINRIPLFDFGYFKYDKVIKLYQNLFGYKNVYIIPFEDFIKNKENVLIDLSDWLGLSQKSFKKNILAKHENTSINGIGIYLKKYLNSIIGRRDSLNSSIPIRISRKNEIKLEMIINFITKLTPYQINNRINNRLKKKIKIFSKNIYVFSNRETEKLTGLKLHSFGYDTK